MEEKIETKKLTGFLKISIVILSVITLASISLLFIGDFEGKFERVFSTLALFIVFVLLTAFDTRKDLRNSWYAPVALIANSYILSLLLIVIWVTPYDPFDLMFSILWKSIFVILTTRLVAFGLELLLNIGQNKPHALGAWGQITSILGVLSLILFTAPIGIEAFKVTIPEIYWKIAVATLIITGLGVTITFLLNWYYTADARQAQKQQPLPTSQPLLPWPTFPDGTPLPQLPDGQPDFQALQRPYPGV